MAPTIAEYTEESSTSSAGIERPSIGGIIRSAIEAAGDRAKAARSPDELVQALFEGYAFATPEQFINALESGAYEIWELEPGAHALIEWVDTRYGKTLNVLTTVGDYTHFVSGLKALERIARKQGANAIYSVGHMGWRDLVQAEGYRTERKLMMIKEL